MKLSAPGLLRCPVWILFALGSGPLPATAQESPAPTPIPVEVFDALAGIQAAQGASYSVEEVKLIFRAVWWDVTYSREEQALARQLGAEARPVAMIDTGGRTLSFTKIPAPDAARQQRFLLPGRYSPNDSSYFVQAFQNTKDGGVFVGACRVHENAAAIMETSLTDMINQARFQAKSAGEEVLLKLFAELEAGYRGANPAIRDEFADVVRRVVGNFAADPKALPEKVRAAAWLRVAAP